MDLQTFETILDVIKKPNTHFMANLLGIRIDAIRHRFVATRRGKGAPGSNAKEPFTQDELIDCAVEALQNKIAQLEAMKAVEAEPAG